MTDQSIRLLRKAIFREHLEYHPGNGRVLAATSATSSGVGSTAAMSGSTCPLALQQRCTAADS